MTKAETKPEEALEDGFVWRSQGGATFAEQCIAIARIEAGDIGGGAERLTALASAPDAGDLDQRVLIMAREKGIRLETGVPDLCRRPSGLLLGPQSAPKALRADTLLNQREHSV